MILLVFNNLVRVTKTNNAAYFRHPVIVIICLDIDLSNHHIALAHITDRILRLTFQVFKARLLFVHRIGIDRSGVMLHRLAIVTHLDKVADRHFGAMSNKTSIFQILGALTE